MRLTKWAYGDKRRSHPAIEHLGISVRESLRRGYAPDIQQFATPAQFEMRAVEGWFRSHVKTTIVSAKSSSNGAGKQHLAGACAAANASGNISGVTDHSDDITT